MKSAMDIQGQEILKLEFDDSSLSESYEDYEEISDNSTELAAVEFEILPPIDITDKRQVEIYNAISEIDGRLEIINGRVTELNQEIDRLTNHADKWDYTIAVASGVICGLIDSFFSNELKGTSHKTINDFVMQFAKMNGYSGKRLSGAVDKIEKIYEVEQDNIWKGKGIGVSATTHHLDDLAHHPTLLGLISGIIVELFRVGIFANRNGEYHFLLIDTDPKDIIKIISPVIISGLLLWIVRIVENKYEDKVGDEIPIPIKKLIKAIAATPMILKVLKVSLNWAGHLVTDMAGSKSTAGGGMGIPGLFISFLKEISMIPGINKTKLPQIVNNLYSKCKIDFRAEFAQSISVVINELIVRSFYFIKYLVEELSVKKDFSSVDWHKVIPFRNRTIVRMMTIATGTFTAIDLADAGIRAVIKSGGFNPATLGNFILRVNFVGVGRFAIAVGTDVGMGIKKGRLEGERSKLLGEQIKLLNAKVFYKEADVWIAAEKTEKAMQELYVVVDKTVIEFVKGWSEIKGVLEGGIIEGVSKLKETDPDYAKKIKHMLKYGGKK